MLRSSPLLAFHRSLLADEVRTEAYRAALQDTVEPGDVVLDLGAGTGILSFFACAAGAARVYAIESGPAVDVARLLARENGLDDRITFLNELSWGVDLPEKVDVVVTETLGNAGIDEGIVDSIADARARLLKPGGVVVPQWLELVAVPVEAPDDYRRVSMWSGELYGLTFRELRSLSANNVHSIVLEPESFLAEPAVLARVDLRTAEPGSIGGELSPAASRSGRLHGIGVWFSAGLTSSLEISTEPPLRMPSWSHAFFPLEEPLGVVEGAPLAFDLWATSNGAEWQWRVEGRRQSTLRGLPLPLERLRALTGRESSVPPPAR